MIFLRIKTADQPGRGGFRQNPVHKPLRNDPLAVVFQYDAGAAVQGPERGFDEFSLYARRPARTFLPVNADNLLVRSADVCLKERKQLVLMPRETPLHTGHCKLFYEASQLGAIIAPPMPAFYARPESLDDMINHTVSRVLDLFGLDSGQLKRWQGVNGSDA